MILGDVRSGCRIGDCMPVSAANESWENEGL